MVPVFRTNRPASLPRPEYVPRRRRAAARSGGSQNQIAESKLFFGIDSLGSGIVENPWLSTNIVRKELPQPAGFNRRRQRQQCIHRLLSTFHLADFGCDKKRCCATLSRASVRGVREPTRTAACLRPIGGRPDLKIQSECTLKRLVRDGTCCTFQRCPWRCGETDRATVTWRA